MRRYYVTVNGNRYEVEVEEVKGDFKSASSEGKSNGSVLAEEKQEEKPVTIVNKPREEKSSISKSDENNISSDNNTSGEKIEAPMPGTILKINVSEGSKVKKGEVLFTLEAMKMENEIMAPREGKVIKVAVTKGAIVNTGELLAIVE